jgi:methyl-accepting chemotaxis protein
VPAHHRRPDNRDRLLFDDRIGLAAARTTRAFLLQSYVADLTDGTRAPCKEVDASIQVNGRQWGAVRLCWRV